MTWKRFIARTISEISALISSFSPPHQGFRILTYHAIGTPVSGDPYGLFSIPPLLFEKHMDALSSYNKASVVDLYNGLDYNGKLKIAITFDDGYKDNLNTAAPILLKYNIPFTVFVSSAYIQSKSDKFLTPSELRELASIPHITVGSHGVNHVPLTECDDSALINELVSSKHYLEDLIGNQITTISYPFGAVNIRVRNAAEKAGYILGVCSHFGINNASCDPLLLRRTEITRTDSKRVLLQKLRGDWDWYRWLRKHHSFT